MSRLRKHYGVVQAVRVWEIHKSGFVHVHAVLMFESRSWVTFLVKQKYRLKKSAKLKECWPHGFSDWIGIYNLGGSPGVSEEVSH